MTKEQETTVRNERIKLSANFLNGTAIATVAIGAVAPFVSFVVGSADVSGVVVALVTPVAIGLGGGLHWTARRALGGLR